MKNEGRDEAMGWDAIDGALSRLYGPREPLHFAPQLPASLGGNDPLDGISVYAAGPPSHWHFVTYGFSELYEKESDDPLVSGHGFELTFRLARGEGDEAPPPWALSLLQNLARYVFKTGNAFDAGHQFPFNGPIALGHDTAITAGLFVRDPQLGAIDTPHGSLVFLQLVGITGDESRAIRAWNAGGMAGFLAAANPLLITSLSRASLLAQPAVASEIAARTAAEGSSSGATFASQLSVRTDGGSVRLTLGARSVESVCDLLRGRLPFGRDFRVLGGGVQVLFRPGARSEARDEGNRLLVELTADAASAVVASLAVRRGIYTFEAVPGFEIEILPTDIKDAQGRVVETVG